MSESQITVMGPGDDLSPSNILIPPKLRATTDKLLWREAVFEWAQTLKACAHGRDSRAKGVAATLGLTLYRSLEFAKKEVVKKAVRTGELRLTPQSEDEILDQMSVAKKVVNLVAKDSTVDRLRPIVRLYKEINGCKRRSKESIKEFVDRFAGPALSYLNLTNSEQDSSDCQNFAIILLLNATLSAQTFNNIISNLVVSAKNRNHERSVAAIPMLKNRLESVIGILNKASSGALNEDEKRTCVECHSTMKSAVFQQEKTFDDDENPSWIGLQDAIRALEEAGLEESDLNNTSSSDKKPESSTRSYLNSNKFNRRNRKRKYNQDNESTENTKDDKKSDDKNDDEEKPQKDNHDKTQGRGRYTNKPKCNWQPRPTGQTKNNGEGKPFFQ